MAGDSKIIATFTVPAVPRDSGSQPQVHKVKLAKTSPGPAPSGPEPPGPAVDPKKELLKKCVDNWALPRPGCEAAQAIHDRWLQWLAKAFAGPNGQGVMANAVTQMCFNQKPKPTTSCSATLPVVFRNFGIPRNDVGSSVLAPWGGNRTKYNHAVTIDNLPRAGDPYFVGHVDGTGIPHHAIYGPMISSGDAPQVTSYAGGQASNMSMIDYKAYPSTLGQDDAGTMLLHPGGKPSKVMWYCDMWEYFKDHLTTIRPEPLNYNLV